MNEVILQVNGEDIPLTEFPSEMIAQTILGMVKALHGVDEDEAPVAARANTAEI